LNLLGGARSTFDLDLLVDMEDENLRKIITILLELGFRPKQPVDPMDFSKREIRENWVHEKKMKAFNFYKGERSLEEVDLLVDCPVDYPAAIRNAEIVHVKHLVIPVIAVEDLIKMKENTGREKDRLDIKELEIIKQQRNEAAGQCDF